MQMITGDSVDNIKGIPGAGPAAAKKLLVIGSGLIDEEEYEAIVQKAYMDKFGNLDEYLLHTKLIGMGEPTPNRSWCLTHLLS